MNWNLILQSGLLKAVICVVLSVAMVLGITLPGMDMDTAPPEVSAMEQLGDIDLHNVGENESDLQTILVPQGGSAAPTEPNEPDPQADPEQTEPQETQPDQNHTDEPDTSDGEEGNDQGNQGEMGGEAMELELSAVMTWYKYGNDPQTLVCGASRAVKKDLNTAQLVNNNLKYRFDLKGLDAKYVTITQVSVAKGDSAYETVKTDGTIEIKLPGGVGNRKYTFQVDALARKKDADGQLQEQKVSFTFVLKCSYSMDLELDLVWQETEGREHAVSCAPDKAEAFTVHNYQVHENKLSYTTRLSGALAEDAEIISAEYSSRSNSKKLPLSKTSGSVPMATAIGQDRETYYLTFAVKTPERTVTFTYNLTFREELDAQLVFTWTDKSLTDHTLFCRPNDFTSSAVKNNQISAGAIGYRVELAGNDGQNGRILGITYTSESGSGKLEGLSGRLPMKLGDQSFVTYRITVTAMVSGQNMNFDVYLHYSNDVTLQMRYDIREEGHVVPRQITCETTRSNTAETVYDDQLSDGMLEYSFAILGDDASDVKITDISCFQSSTGRTISLKPDGSITLLLKNGRIGENTFTVKAEGPGGSEYSFEINIPYKHRGGNTIKIETNLTEGQKIINDALTNLSVRAWQEDDAGRVVNYIPANGTDTKLIVTFDEEVVSYISTSDASSEYALNPKNPEEGDTNTHILHIYAEDAHGNFGEKTLTLTGLRREAGQKTGTASIYVDLTVLGLGVRGPVQYDVLANEPVSYVIYKGVMGEDAGEPFGAASATFGWPGYYEGTLDIGFYLASLTTSLHADALEDEYWPGDTDEEVFAAIDARFGKNSGLGTLWRCIYNNGLTKAPNSGSTFGEMDYTTASGWMYSIGGSVYYPGQSMSQVYLQNGDVLTLRYTLAQGWDVGGGNENYGKTAGYCVSALNGKFYINHQMQTTTVNGKEVEVCHCCGLILDCDHANTAYQDLETGRHILQCLNPECKSYLGEPEDHEWTGGDADVHQCEICLAQEDHQWQIIRESTATCTEPGEEEVQCRVCDFTLIRQEDVAEHTLDDRWYHDESDHFRKCSTCGEEIPGTRGKHNYQHEGDDWYCQVCGVGHEWDYCGNDDLDLVSATCQEIEYYCSQCATTLTEEGNFPDYHDFLCDICRICGYKDDWFDSKDHNWSDWEITDPQPGVPGREYRYCYSCGAEEDYAIDALPEDEEVFE